MSADSVPSSKTNIFQNKLIYCRHYTEMKKWMGQPRQSLFTVTGKLWGVRKGQEI